jgi:methylmalonyl-CoA mutase
VSQIQFIKPSFEEIKSKIQQELKDKSFEEKIIHSQNGIELMPIYTKDTTPIPIQVFPYVEDRIFFQSLTISNDIESINNEIIVALENGASGLRLDFKDISQSMDWNVLFHNIRFDYIYTQLLNISDNLKKSFNEYLSYQKYEIKENQVLFEESFYVIKDSNFFEDVVFLLQKVESNSLNSPYHISIQLKGDYFWDLCKIRAFKILFDSIRQKFHLEKGLIIACTHIETGSSIHENNLLMLTTQALSGLIAGCDGMVIDTFNGEYNSFSNRMSRNIFNILKEEAYLDKVDDPSFGSYFIENYTKKIAEKIYQLL